NVGGDREAVVGRPDRRLRDCRWRTNRRRLEGLAGWSVHAKNPLATSAAGAIRRKEQILAVVRTAGIARLCARRRQANRLTRSAHVRQPDLAVASILAIWNRRDGEDDLRSVGRELGTGDLRNAVPVVGGKGPFGSLGQRDRRRGEEEQTRAAHATWW